jgi:NodT family efflux transporter outer membrane factor (OMF) lipoprotein
MTMRVRKALIFIFVFILLSACVNKLSEVDSPLIQMTPDQWRQPKLPDAVNTLLWTAFQDPVLDRLMSAALEKNLSIELTKQRLHAAQIALQSLRASVLPRVNLTGGYTRNGGKHLANNNRWITQAGAAYEVSLWGRVAKQTQLKVFDRSVAEVDLQAARITLASKIAEKYFRLWSTDRRLQLQKQSLGKAKKRRELVNARFKGGLAIMSDVDRQDVLVADLETNIADLNSNRTLLENSLAVLLDTPLQSFNFDVNSRQLSSLIKLSPGTPAEILRNRPDIKTAELSLAQSHINVDLVRTRLYPTLDLTAAISYSADDLGSLFDTALLPWNVLVDFAQPIFDGGVRQAELDREALRHQQVITKFKSTVLTAIQDVESVLVQQASIIRQQESVKRKRAAQQRITDQAALKYLQGEISALDLLIDENALIEVEKQEVDVWLRGMLASIYLLRALGVDPLTAINTDCYPKDLSGNSCSGGV